MPIAASAPPSHPTSVGILSRLASKWYRFWSNTRPREHPQLLLSPAKR
ncbi:MAG: hypothetical protein QOC80_1056 [Frankiaceae bacterium]|nr:hypothetical protein [Frankiaceae bacterium]